MVGTSNPSVPGMEVLYHISPYFGGIFTYIGLIYKYIYIYLYIPSGPQVSAMGGVGWGMLTSCSCYIDATFMGGVGWGGACQRHVHVTLMLRS